MAAAKASANAPRRSKPGRSLVFTGDRFYCKTLEDCNRAALTALRHTAPLGFDVEWRVTYRKGEPARRVALVQLCDGACCVLFHIFLCASFPAALRAILEDPLRVKCGVGAANDAAKLARDWRVSCAGVVELGQLSRAKISTSLSFSLNALCVHLLHRGLSKPDCAKSGALTRTSQDVCPPKT